MTCRMMKKNGSRGSHSATTVSSARCIALATPACPRAAL